MPTNGDKPVTFREFFELKLQHLEEQQRELHAETQKQIMELTGEIKQLLELERRVTELERNPSLLWYWRYKPKETLFWFVLIATILTFVVISDLRHPIMDILGIPRYQP